MPRGSEVLALVLAALLLRGSVSPGVPAPPAAVDSRERARVNTGAGDDTMAWFQPRFALALEVLGPNVPSAVLRDVALSVMAQWAHETNRGKSEFCFNLGGWRARSKDPYFVARDVMSGNELFRWTAYGDLPNAVHDQLRRLHSTFPTAWAKLVADPRSSAWIEELGRKGYYTADRSAYARAWAMQRAEFGRLVA